MSNTENKNATLTEEEEEAILAELITSGTPHVETEEDFRAAEARALQRVEEREKARKSARKSRCWKCGGSGYISAYSHISGGRCFAC
jgi:hypothetical protein